MTSDLARSRSRLVMAMEGSIVETQHLKGGGGSKASAPVNNLPSVKRVRICQVISLK